MQVKDIMTSNIEFIEPDASIAEAARKMQQLNIGFLPVGSGGNVSGVITDRDIVLRAIANKSDPETTRVKEIMTSGELVSIPEEADVWEACRKMEESQVRRLLVTDKDDNFCGVTSLADIAVKTGEHELIYETIEKVSEPAHRK